MKPGFLKINPIYDYRSDTKVYPIVHEDKYIEPLVIPRKNDDPTRNVTLIFIHGLGSSAKKSQNIINTWRENFPYMKCICPSATSMPITANFGMLVPAWFDVNELGTRNFPIDGWKGLLESVQMVRKILIDEVNSGTPPHRIILAGFSQGAVVAIATAFNTSLKIGAIISLSGFYYIPNLDMARTHILLSENRDTPIFIAHGEKDSIILVEAAYCTNSALNEPYEGYYHPNLLFKIYLRMDHIIIKEEHADVINFLHKYVPVMRGIPELNYDLYTLKYCQELAQQAKYKANEGLTGYNYSILTDVLDSFIVKKTLNDVPKIPYSDSNSLLCTISNSTCSQNQVRLRSIHTQETTTNIAVEKYSSCTRVIQLIRNIYILAVRFIRMMKNPMVDSY